MMAVKYDQNVFNSIFSLMAGYDDEGNINEATLFYLKGDLDTLPIINLRKLVALLIESIDEQTTENLMLNGKLILCGDDNSTLKSQISELSVRIGILKTDSPEPNKGPCTSKGGKRKLSVFEEDLEEKFKTSEFKLIASLETNAQLWKDLTK